MPRPLLEHLAMQEQLRPAVILSGRKTPITQNNNMEKKKHGKKHGKIGNKMEQIGKDMEQIPNIITSPGFTPDPAGFL